MRAPPSLMALLEDGLIEAVLRPLQSGKEAQVYLVRAAGQACVAKIYKGADERNFKNRSVYQEGRGTRNTRDQRAMKRRSSYGRSRDEEAWQTTEVEMIHRLRDAGVRVPRPFVFADGVLVMELVQGADGEPAPRLGDLRVNAEEAVEIHDALLRDVVRMLCAGVVHGDLSEFNVLVDDDGPVIIDLPQAVDASSNQNARTLLLRDVENLQRFVTRWVPGRKRANYAAEMWALYEVNELEPDTELTGVHEGSKHQADTDALLGLIADAEEDETMRRLQRGLAPLETESGGRRVFINRDAGPPRRGKASRGGGAKSSSGGKRKAGAKSGSPSPSAPPPSKAPSRDELIAQAIAARQAAASAPASSKSDRSPRGGEAKGRRRRKRGEDAEPSHGRPGGRVERTPGERGAGSGERGSKPAPAERSRSRGDSGADESRGRRRRRRKPDGAGERSAAGDRPAAGEGREGGRAPKAGQPAKPERGGGGGRPTRKKRSGEGPPRRERGDDRPSRRERTDDRPPRQKRTEDGRRGSSSSDGPERRRERDDAAAGSRDAPSKRRRRRRKGGGSGSSSGKPDE